MPGKKSSKGIWAAAAVVFLVLSIAAVVVFQTNILGVKVDGYDDELLPSIKLTGPIKEKHLKLSGKEITSLNNLSRSHGDLFSAMHMNLSLENKFAPLEIEEDTVMILKLTCTAASSEVAFRSREVRRSELVKHMQRSMKKAESEFQRYRDKSGTGKLFRRLVI